MRMYVTVIPRVLSLRKKKKKNAYIIISNQSFRNKKKKKLTTGSNVFELNKRIPDLMVTIFFFSYQ